MKLKNNILLIGDPADGGGGAVFGDPPSGGGGGAPDGGEGGGGDGGGEPDGEPAGGGDGSPPAATPQLTPDAIAEAMKKVGIGAPAPAAQPPVQYTQEDFDKAFQVFQPSAELLTALAAGGEAGVKALAQLRDGLVRQAVTMASYIVQDQIEKYEAKFRPQFEPVAKYVTEKQVKELYDEFYTTNKELKPYDSIVQAAVQQLKGEGANFKTKEEGFKAAAERTKAILKASGISLEAGAPGGGSPNPTRMPTLSKGGQGGLGKGPSGGGGAKDPSHAVFG